MALLFMRGPQLFLRQKENPRLKKNKLITTDLDDMNILTLWLPKFKSWSFITPKGRIVFVCVCGSLCPTICINITGNCRLYLAVGIKG